MSNEPERTVVQATANLDGREVLIVTGDGPGPLVTPDGAPFPAPEPEPEAG
jgi:hypothetical protein